MRPILDIAVRVSMLLALVAAPGFVRAQAAGGQTPAIPAAPEAITRSVGRTPVSAEMVVVVDGLAAARKTPAFLALFGALSDLGLTAELKKWPILAAQLGLSENEALDSLLGSRVMLVIDSLAAGEDTPWAILSDITAETDQRIKDRIPLAPRKAVDGVPVFAMERGDYEIATVRAAAGDRVTFLLGPSGRSALFDNMVRGLLKPAQGTLTDTPVIRELAEHSSPGILLAMRIDQDAPAGGNVVPGNWSDFLVCTAAPRDNAWECRLTVRDIAVQPSLARVRATSDAPLTRMAQGAMLAILESRLAAPGGEPGGMFDRILSLFAFPEGAEGILTGRQALAVWPRTPARPEAEDATLCVAVAMETTDAVSMAPIGDRHLAKLVETIERAFGNGGAPVPDFAGASYQAVRTVPLELPASANRLFDGPPRVAWSYPTAGGAGKEAGPRPGWWQICVGGASEGAGVEGGLRGACGDASRQMAESLVQPVENGAGVERWVSLGTMRPSLWAPIVKMLPAGAELFGVSDPVRLLRRLERVEWRLMVRSNDDVGGTLRIEFAPDQP